MSEIKLCKDCKHFSPPINVYYSQQAAAQGIAWGGAANPFNSQLHQIDNYQKPASVGLCKRADLWTTEPVYGLSVAVNEKASEAKWQRESGECGTDARCFELKHEPELPIVEISSDPWRGGLFGGSFGSITVPHDVLRPWWKFWGKV